MCFSDHVEPRDVINYFTHYIADSLTPYTLSDNQSIKILIIFSFKNSGPISFAKKLIISIEELRILQLLSTDSSYKAGTIDYERVSTPSILVISFSLLNIVILTSESSSLRSYKNIGKMKSVVFFFPICELKAKKEFASEHLT